MRETVLFIPGIFGSRLRAAGGELVWPPTPAEAVGVGYRRTDKLLRADLHADGVIGRLCIDVYGGVMKALEDMGYEDGGAALELIRYDYDWRLDLITLAGALDARLTALVEQHPATVIKLVCHSMGGLLARACLERAGASARPWYDKVALAVFLATPHQGAPLAYARAIGVGGGSMGVSEADMQRLCAAAGFPTGYQLFPPAALQPVWSLDGATLPLAPTSVFDPALAAAHPLTVQNLAAAANLATALDVSRRPPRCRYFAVASAAHETVTRLDQRLGDLTPVKVKASGDGTVPVTSAAALPIQTAFVEANHMGVPAKPATQRLLAMLLGRARPGPVIAATLAGSAPRLSLGDRLVTEGDPVEILVTTPPRDRLSAVIRIDQGFDDAAMTSVAALEVRAEAPELARVALTAPPLGVGRYLFRLEVDGVSVDLEELLVTTDAVG